MSGSESGFPPTTIVRSVSPDTYTARSRRCASSWATVDLPEAGTPVITKSATGRSSHAGPSAARGLGLVLAELLVGEVRGRARGGGAQHRGLPYQQRPLQAEALQRGRGGQQRMEL